MEVTRYNDKCMVKQANSSSSVEAEVFEFTPGERLTVVLDKSVKLPMVWNGQLYEGRMAGLDFVSAGPHVTRTSTGR